MSKHVVTPLLLVIAWSLATALSAAEPPAAGAGAPAATRSAGAATQPGGAAQAGKLGESGAVDYYALTAEAFFKRPEVAQRIGPNAANLPLLEAAIFHETNRQRAEQKLPLFKHGLAMNLMARRHSTEMATLQFFDHESPTAANATLTDRLRNVGLERVPAAGENIAMEGAQSRGPGGFVVKDPIDGSETWYGVSGPGQYHTYADLAATFAAQWKKSPGHWQNICNRQFVYLGVGVARGVDADTKQDSFYATQNFCATAVAASEAKAKAALEGKTAK